MSVFQGMADRGRPSLFTPDAIAKLRKLYCAGLTYDQMGEELGMKSSTVRQFVRVNLTRLGLTKRTERRHNPKTFEKEWYGLVPRGHWTICKPWGSKGYTRAVGQAIRNGCDVSIT